MVMKILVMAMVLMAISIAPMEAQDGYEVSDAKMMAEPEADVNPIFEDETSKAICINHTYLSNGKILNYIIIVKNTGETQLESTILEDIFPAGVYFNYSKDLNSSEELTPKEIVRNRDSTTERVIWEIGILNTSEERRILVVARRSAATNDKQNAVEVRAVALNRPEGEQLKALAKKISSINASYEYTKTSKDVIISIESTNSDNVTHYEIRLKNPLYVKLNNVVLNVTLPKNTIYLNSIPSTNTSNPDNTADLGWSLGDFEASELKVIKLNITSNDSDSGRSPRIEARGLIIRYNITVNNTGETRLTDVVLNDTLPERMYYSESRYAENTEVEGTLPEPTIISNPDGTTKRLIWFLGDLETGTDKAIELDVSFLNDTRSIENNEVQASGNTSIVHKIPISVNSTPWSMASSETDGEEEKTSNTTAPPSPPPEGNDTEMKVPEVNESAVNASFIDGLTPEINSTGI